MRRGLFFSRSFGVLAAGLVIVLFFVAAAFAASTCPQDNYASGRVGVVEMSWTAHTDGTFTSTQTEININGFVYLVETDPGTTAPTDNYDITLTDRNGTDVMGGALANRDTTTTETAAPLLSDGTAWVIPVFGPLTLNISNNSVNAAKGVVRIFYQF